VSLRDHTITYRHTSRLAETLEARCLTESAPPSVLLKSGKYVLHPPFASREKVGGPVSLGDFIIAPLLDDESMAAEAATRAELLWNLKGGPDFAGGFESVEHLENTLLRLYQEEARAEAPFFQCVTGRLLPLITTWMKNQAVPFEDQNTEEDQ